MCECEVWIMVDADGCYAAGTDPSEFEAPDPGVATRLVKITVKVPKPAVVELTAAVPEEPPVGELKVA